MRHFEVFLAVMLLPLPVLAADHAVPARVATLTIDPREVTILNLRPEFESSIRMPEDVTSVILGSPGAFKAEHNEGEPQYVYVKPITKEPAQSNLLIATKSGQHVTIELISAGTNAASDTPPVDFLIEYRTSRSFLVAGDTPGPIAQKTTDKGQERKMSSRAADNHPAPAMRPDRLSTRCSRNRRRSMLLSGRSGRAARSKHRSAVSGSGRTRRWSLTRSLTTRTPRSRLCRHRSRLPGANRTKRNRRRVRAFSPIRWRYAITSSARRGSNRGRAPTAWSSSTGPISKSPPNNSFSR
jgi:hypothetical protein